jgi:hypothetical protein
MGRRQSGLILVKDHCPEFDNETRSGASGPSFCPSGVRAA